MFEKISVYARMIKFSHTIFALPFALSAVILAQRRYPMTLWDIFWILVAMVGARSAAMGFNRIADIEFDAKNPRTASREIPSGKLSFKAAVIFVVIFSALFIFASAMIAEICFYLSFPVLVILLSYSYTKRFTWFSHIYLGFAISLAPIGAWIAIAKSFSMPIVLLSLALMTYIAGFDILYACQDKQFDEQEGLFSIPVRFGIERSLSISAILHSASFICFVMIFFVFEMQIVYLISIIIIGILYRIEHGLLKPHDLTRLDIAFFHVNSLISITVFAGILADEIVRRI